MVFDYTWDLSDHLGHMCNIFTLHIAHVHSNTNTLRQSAKEVYKGRAYRFTVKFRFFIPFSLFVQKTNMSFTYVKYVKLTRSQVIKLYKFTVSYTLCFTFFLKENQLHICNRLKIKHLSFLNIFISSPRIHWVLHNMFQNHSFIHYPSA